MQGNELVWKSIVFPRKPLIEDNEKVLAHFPTAIIDESLALQGIHKVF
jgi:hypothetical protein